MPRRAVTGGDAPNASPPMPPTPLETAQKTTAGSFASTRIFEIERPLKVFAPSTSFVGVGLNGPYSTGVALACSTRYSPTPKKESADRFASPVPT